MLEGLAPDGRSVMATRPWTRDFVDSSGPEIGEVPPRPTRVLFFDGAAPANIQDIPSL